MSHQSRADRAEAGRVTARSFAMIAIAAALISDCRCWGGSGRAAGAPRVFARRGDVYLPGDLPGRRDHPGQHRHPAGHELRQDLEAAERRQLRLGAGHHCGLDDVRRRHDDGQRGAGPADLPGAAGAVRQSLRDPDRVDGSGHLSERLEAAPDERRDSSASARRASPSTCRSRSTPATTAERITFASGATVWSKQGSLTFPNRKEFVLRALAGQVMTVAIVSPKNLANFAITGVSDGQPYKRLENERSLLHDHTAQNAGLPDRGCGSERRCAVRAVDRGCAAAVNYYNTFIAVAPSSRHASRSRRT